jgi:hypothetical protein
MIIYFEETSVVKMSLECEFFPLTPNFEPFHLHEILLRCSLLLVCITITLVSTFRNATLTVVTIRYVEHGPNKQHIRDQQAHSGGKASGF